MHLIKSGDLLSTEVTGSEGIRGKPEIQKLVSWLLQWSRLDIVGAAPSWRGYKELLKRPEGDRGLEIDSSESNERQRVRIQGAES